MKIIAKIIKDTQDLVFAETSMGTYRIPEKYLSCLGERKFFDSTDLQKTDRLLRGL